jgi:hypothetical protein
LSSYFFSFHLLYFLISISFSSIILSSLSFSYFSFLLLLSNQNKTKKDKQKDKSIPCVMCITNDDAIRNGSKCNDVMRKKMLEEGEGKQKKKEMVKKL